MSKSVVNGKGSISFTVIKNPPKDNKQEKTKK